LLPNYKFKIPDIWTGFYMEDDVHDIPFLVASYASPYYHVRILPLFALDMRVFGGGSARCPNVLTIKFIRQENLISILHDGYGKTYHPAIEKDTVRRCQKRIPTVQNFWLRGDFNDCCYGIDGSPLRSESTHTSMWPPSIKAVTQAYRSECHPDPWKGGPHRSLSPILWI
jgi:hypothetical protein